MSRIITNKAVVLTLVAELPTNVPPEMAGAWLMQGISMSCAVSGSVRSLAVEVVDGDASEVARQRAPKAAPGGPVRLQ